jgi:hypothetical protein
MTHLETVPEQLSAEYWQACLEVREYLINELDGLVLGIGLVEPDDESDDIIFFISPAGPGHGAIMHNFETGVFTVTETPQLNLSKLIVKIGVYGVPRAEVSELLRAAVEMLDIIE